MVKQDQWLSMVESLSVDIINNGTGFRRIPEIRIYDDGKNCGTDGGYGASLFQL